MHPILIDFGWREVPLLGRTHIYLGTYGVLFALAALAGWFVWMSVARRDGLAVDRIVDIGFYALFTGIIGSKVGLVLTDPGYFLASPAALLWTLRAAGVLLVGVVAGVATVALTSRRAGIPFWAVLDSMAPSLALAQAIGRIGCFMAGCCYGRQAPGLPWGVCFTDPAAAAISGTPICNPNDPPASRNILHPVQLYQAGADVLLFLLLLYLARTRKMFMGARALLFIVAYSVSRFLIELLRGDAERGLYQLPGTSLVLSTSQYLCAAGLIFAVIMASRLAGRARSAPQPAPRARR